MALVLLTLAWRFLSAKEFYWDWANWHYNAILIPIVVGALLDVLARLKTAQDYKKDSIRYREFFVQYLGVGVYDMRQRAVDGEVFQESYYRTAGGRAARHPPG